MKYRIVMKLKILDAPVEVLNDVADRCRRARNAATENWLLRQRGFPETEAQGRIRNDKGLSESTKLYHAVRAAEPDLDTQIAAAIGREIKSYLSAKVDWRRRDEKQARRSDAILEYADRPPFSTATKIPVMCSQTTIHVTAEDISVHVAHFLRGDRGVTLQLSRRIPSHMRKRLAALATGQLKLADATLLVKDDQWFLFLPVELQAKPLDPKKRATLTPQPPCDEGGQSDRPFRLEFPDEPRPWFIGDGRYYLAQCARFEAIIKQIGWRYRQRQGAGHGRKKVDEAKRRRRKQFQDVRAEFRRRLICDVVRQCANRGIGTLIYRDPTGPAKELLWFAQRGCEWDWTRFDVDLKNALARAGITMFKDRLKISEVKDELAMRLLRDGDCDSGSSEVLEDGEGQCPTAMQAVS
jgi:hypothetical protein